MVTPHGWDDCQWWVANDKGTLKRVNRLLDEIVRSPFQGIGKPGPLRHILAGCWSRRIDEEHRLIYLVDHDDIVVLLARFHYA